MASMAQINANRANALHSTGPRTEEGKARSSLNAVKHGLNSKEFFVRDDEREEFDELRQSLAAEVNPQTALDWSLFTQLLHARWTMRRVDVLEAELFATSPDPLAGDDARRLELLARYYTRAERSFYRALKELRVQLTNHVTRDNLPVPLCEEAPALVRPDDLSRSSIASLRAWRGLPREFRPPSHSVEVVIPTDIHF